MDDAEDLDVEAFQLGAGEDGDAVALLAALHLRERHDVWRGDFGRARDGRSWSCGAGGARTSGGEHEDHGGREGEPGTERLQHGGMSLMDL